MPPGTWMFLFSLLKGYDKLKPYGFPIHGAIGGFSRRILWLDVVKSNNNPRVPGKLLLEYVKEVGGCPLLLVSDCGTENGVAAAMQCTFRSGSLDDQAGESSHRYCSSPSNQRIEGWWSFLRHNRSSWWMDLFKDMVEHGTLHLGNILHMECLWFCFPKILQDDLNKVRDHWNSHRITKSRHSTVEGVPDVMYYLPEYYSMEECLNPVSIQQTIEMEQHCELVEEESEYQEYFEFIMDIEGLNYPSTVEFSKSY
ncbi:uncharacterized protein LOC117112423 isoform X2 [Anneissia japonica]|uniref:uncharacterized protein LOC117112423 isoform X2 n=1 Tax=Anneissia japonica TaxID=1529436 RepID=UPI00142559D1|nr:uncharacterized protein LOC117112423 isoform X2 [Anneissia japonica]